MNIFAEISAINPNKSKMFQKTSMSPTFETVLINTLYDGGYDVLKILPLKNHKDKVFYAPIGSTKVNSINISGNNSAFEILTKIKSRNG